MTHDEIMALDMESVETRMAEIGSIIESADDETDLEALSAELEDIKTRKTALMAEIEERKADVAAILDGKGAETIEIPQEERKTMDIMEIRKSEEYINAFAEYIKSGKDEECRALLTNNVATGVVPVPTLVDDIVRNAWEKEGVMSRVKKAYLKGNLQVGFEVSADAAAIHTEGANAPAEEKLVLGIVELVPASIKKWITISDEVVDMKGEAFLRYIYDELTYQIAKKAADTLIGKIISCGTESTNTPTTNVAVAAISTGSVSLGLVAQAIAELSDQAANPVIVMNKATWASFKAAQYAANFAADPFEGLDVVFNNSIPAFSAATTGETFAIVGDLGYGVLANFPNGDDITIKYDELSLAEKDLVKIVGREYVGMEVVAPLAFTKIEKAAAAES